MLNTLQEIPLALIDGTTVTLAHYAGKVLLVVNVASRCGMTPQYATLESLYQKYRERGFEVLGFPANDFGDQEPGTEAEIGNFCYATYGVEFPMFSKVVATGANKHPLYRTLVETLPETEYKEGSGIRAYQLKHHPKVAASPEVHWNFEKFLIDRSGNITRRFGSDTEPDAPEIVSAIEKALSES